MNSVTLVLPETLADDLLHMAEQPLETGAVLLARRARAGDGGLRLIGVRLIPMPETAYLDRTDRSLGVASEGYMPALREAENGGCIAFWVHCHPGSGSSPTSSKHDTVVDQQLGKTFAVRTGSGLYGALIVSAIDGRLTFTGHVDGDDTASIDRIFVVDARFRLIQAFDATIPDPPTLHDRHVRAFGTEIPAVLAALRVTIIGAGGTGSAVAEQLVRLGVRNIMLIDPKTVSETNPTRVYGSTPRDVGRAKVDVIADHLERIADGVRVTRIVGTVSTRKVAEQVVGADVVFGCTDDDAGRLRLSRFSYMYLTPLIDCGIQITATDDGQVQDIVGRVTVLHPGAACLLCRERVSTAIAAAQERPAEEQTRLAAEGYAPALVGVEPAVVAYTTAVAAAAVNELLERLVGYGATPPPSEILLRIHDRKISENHQDPTVGHYCDPTSPMHFGDTDRYWGLGWTS